MASTGDQRDGCAHLIGIVSLVFMVVGIITGGIFQLYPDHARTFFHALHQRLVIEKDHASAMSLDQAAQSSPVSVTPVKPSELHELPPPSASSTPATRLELQPIPLETAFPAVSPAVGETPARLSVKDVDLLRRLLREALAAAAYVFDSSNKDEALIAISQAQSRIDDWQMAEKTAAIVGPSQWAAARSRAAIAHAQFRAGNPNGGRSTLSDLEARCKWVAELATFAQVRYKIGDVQLAKEDIAAARMAVDGPEDGTQKVHDLCEVALALYQCHERTEYRETLAQARTAAASHKKPYYRAHGLAWVALAEALCGEEKSSRDTIDQAKTIVRTFTRISDIEENLRDIAQAQARGGDITGAKNTAARIPDALDKEWAGAVITQEEARTLARQGNTSAAEATVRKLDQQYWCFGYLAVADGLLNKIDPETRLMRLPTTVAN